MTREEAIEVIGQDIPCEHDRDLIEALEMAISALSEELSEDGTLTVHVKDGSKVKRVFVMGDNIFGGLYYPDSAENKGEWIPVSESLPEDDTEVVYCTEMGTVGSCHYFDGFNHYPGCNHEYIFDDVVAWFPIPEVPLEKDWWNAPYKAESEGTECQQ